MSLQELKDVVKQANIVDVISHYFSVQKKGSLHQCQCPFHNDTNPSLKINEEKGIFKCFVCNTAGDSISFVQKHERIDFVEALKKTATILNIPLENYLDTPKKNPKKEMGKRVLKAAQKLFLKHSESDSYKNILDNFLESRKLTQQTAKKFGIGYTPGRSTLAQYLQRIPDQKDRDFALKEALELSVVKRNDQGRLYDYFNNRITFPIWDFFGSVVGFGSRVIEKEQQPKYLNSKESFLFNKRNLLYGFHLAKPAIREKNCVLLVEGYMDAIALHQGGFSQSVAIMGIAISEQNAKELKRLTSNIYLALDSDDAGYKAMVRVNQEFMKLGLIPKYLNFAPHNDPDDYIKEEGADAFNQLMKNAPAFIDKKLQELASSLEGEPSPELKRQCLNRAFELLTPLRSDISATERVVSFARKIGLATGSKDILRNYDDFLKAVQSKKSQYNRSKNQQNQQVAAKKRATQPKPSFNSAPMPTQEPSYQSMHDSLPPEAYMDNTPPHYVSDPLNSNPHYPEQDEKDHASREEPLIKDIEISSSTRHFIRHLTIYPQLFDELNIAEVLDFLSHTEVKRYINRAFELYFESDDGELESLIRRELEIGDYPYNLREIVLGEFFNDQPPKLEKKEQSKLVEGMIKSLEIDSLLMKKREIRELHKTSKNMTDYNESLKQIHTIDQQIAKLKTK